MWKVWTTSTKGVCVYKGLQTSTQGLCRQMYYKIWRFFCVQQRWSCLNVKAYDNKTPLLKSALKTVMDPLVALKCIVVILWHLKSSHWQSCFFASCFWTDIGVNRDIILTYAYLEEPFDASWNKVPTLVQLKWFNNLILAGLKSLSLGTVLKKLGYVDRSDNSGFVSA